MEENEHLRGSSPRTGRGQRCCRIRNLQVIQTMRHKRRDQVEEERHAPLLRKLRRAGNAIHELRFSPDGRLVYFETPAWATSGALHVVDTTTCREHFICAGGMEGFRGNNLVTVESVYNDNGHQNQRFLRGPEGKMLATLSQPFAR
jgi:hypothetical protein